MVMMFLGEPVWLILAYGVLGAFFMPFLAVTLLWLLNTDRTPGRVAQQDRSPTSAMALCALAFAALAFNEVRKAIAAESESAARLSARRDSRTRKPLALASFSVG